MNRFADDIACLTLKAPDTAETAVVSDGGGNRVSEYTVDSGEISIPRGDVEKYDIYLIEWDSGSAELFERIQRRYIDEDDLRKYKKGLSDSVDVQSAIDSMEAVFDRAASRSFCLKGKREEFIVEDARFKLLSEIDVYQIYTVTVDGVETDSWKLYDGRISIKTPGVAAIHYAYGLQHPPADLKECALLYASSIVGESNGADPRMTGEQNEFGYIRYSVPGRDGATGIPKVDVFLSGDKANGGMGNYPVVIL